MIETDKPRIRILSIRFTIEDDGDGYSIQVFSATDKNGCPEPYNDDWIVLEADDDETVEQHAARVILEAGCSEDVGSWWQDPDGSHTVDYGTGEREETSAHPYGLTDDQLVTIANLVGKG